MARKSHFPGFGFIAVAAIVLTAPLARGQDKDDTFRERLEYDPAKGEWLEKAPPIAGTEEGDLALGRLHLARGEYKKARKVFELWFKSWPESAHRPEALFYAAETEVSAVEDSPRSGDLMKAYRWLQELIEGWPGTELSNRALHKELIIAEMILFKHRKQRVWKTLWLSAEEEALQMLDKIIDDLARDTPIAEQALRLKADFHFQNGEFEEAELAYARLTRDFPRGRYHKVSMLRSGQSALGRFPGVEFDDADLLEAEVYFQDFSQRFPADSEANMVPQTLARIKESRAEKDYTVARYYERVKKYDAAAYYYRFIDKNYPATTWAAQARNRLIALGHMEPPAETVSTEATPPQTSQPASNE